MNRGDIPGCFPCQYTTRRSGLYLSSPWCISWLHGCSIDNVQSSRGTHNPRALYQNQYTPSPTVFDTLWFKHSFKPQNVQCLHLVHMAMYGRFLRAFTLLIICVVVSHNHVRGQKSDCEGLSQSDCWKQPGCTWTYLSDWPLTESSLLFDWICMEDATE